MCKGLVPMLVEALETQVILYTETKNSVKALKVESEYFLRRVELAEETLMRLGVTTNQIESMVQQVKTAHEMHGLRPDR